MNYASDKDIEKYTNIPNLSLVDLLPFVIREDGYFPHMQAMATGLYNVMVAKFLKCTEAERRHLTRSDPEFMLIMKEQVMKRCGFKTELEAFGKEIEIPKIPKIKRGKEFLWHTLADPDPVEEQYDEQTKDFVNICKSVIPYFLASTKECYPEEYTAVYGTTAISLDNYKLSHEGIEKLMTALYEEGQDAFAKMLRSMIIESIILHIAERCNIKPKKIKKMRKVIERRSLTIELGEDDIRKIAR